MVLSCLDGAGRIGGQLLWPCALQRHTLYMRQQSLTASAAQPLFFSGLRAFAAIGTAL